MANPSDSNGKVQPTGGVTIWSDTDLDRLAQIDEAALLDAIQDARRRFPELMALIEAKPYDEQGDDEQGDDDGQSA